MKTNSVNSTEEVTSMLSRKITFFKSELTRRYTKVEWIESPYHGHYMHEATYTFDGFEGRETIVVTLNEEEIRGHLQLLADSELY